MSARRVLLLAGAGLGIALTFVGPPARTGTGVLGHFLCDKTKQTQGDVCVAASEVNPGAACLVDEDCGTSADLCRENKLPKGTRAGIADVNDGLGSQVDVRKGVALCNPADKNGEGFVNEIDHLRSFTIAVAKTSPAQPPLPALTDVEVSNQFGSIQLDQKKLDRLMLPAGKSVKGCTVVETEPGGSIRPSDALLCYQAKRAQGQAKHVKVLGLYVAHELARERLDTVKEEELCVPSELIF